MQFLIDRKGKVITAAIVEGHGKQEMNDHRVEKPVFTYLLYDADCGPCTRFKNLVIRLDIDHKLVPIPMKSEFAYDLVRGRETRAEMMQAFHIVLTDASVADGAEQNDIFSAGDALIQLTRLLPLGSITYWAIAHFRPLRSFIRWLYPRIAELRNISVSCRVSYPAPRIQYSD